MLTEDEKTDIVYEYNNLVCKIAWRYRYFDNDIDEIKGWGYLGLAKAIAEYEKKLEEAPESELITTWVLLYIKSEIYNGYRKNSWKNSTKSMSEVVSEDFTLEDKLSDNSELFLNERDIMKLLSDALKSVSSKNRKVIIESLIGTTSDNDILDKYKLNKSQLLKIKRRGIAIIKKYLYDYDLVENIDNKEYTYNKGAIKPLKVNDLAKIKYIRKNFNFLNANDISQLLNVNSYTVQEIINNPPTQRYRSVEEDDSIHKKVLQFVKQRYPECLPGKVHAS